MATRWYRAVAYQEPGDGPEDGWDVIFPDLPGCVATGATVDETEQRMREAIALHLEGMAADGSPLPDPSGGAGVYVERRARSAA